MESPTQPHAPPPPPQPAYVDARLVGQQQGMSGGAKLALGLGAGCLVMCLICGGVFVATIALLVPAIERAADSVSELAENAAEYVSQAWSEDPVKVREVTLQIAPISIPESFQPEGCFQLFNPIEKSTMVSFAMWQQPEADGLLLLSTLNLISDDPVQIQNKMQEIAQHPDFVSHGRRRFDPIAQDEIREIELVVRDAPARFFLSRGVEQDSGHEYRQAVGSFQGTDQPAGLLIRVRSDSYTEDQFLDLLETIR